MDLKRLFIIVFYILWHLVWIYAYYKTEDLDCLIPIFISVLMSLVIMAIYFAVQGNMLGFGFILFIIVLVVCA